MAEAFPIWAFVETKARGVPSILHVDLCCLKATGLKKKNK